MTSLTPKDEMKSFTIQISNLELGAEPSFVYRMFDGNELKSNIQEIECNSSGDAWVTFDTKEAAEKAIKKFDNARSHVKQYKLAVSRVPGYQVGQDKLKQRLTDFLMDQKPKNGFRTSTVRIINLPHGRTKHSLNLLLEHFMERYENDHPKYAPRVEAVEIPGNEDGVALVQFSHKTAAWEFVSEYNGDYWKNATIYVECIRDDEIETAQEKQDRKAGKNVGFWVGNLKAGFTEGDLRSAFKPFVLQDVNIPPASKDGSRPVTFAFVFMTQADGVAFGERFPQGFKYGGRWIKVRPNNGKKANRQKSPSGDVAGLAAATSSLKITPSVSRGPTDVRVDNLPYTANKITLRELFKDFKTTKFVSKAAEGYGFVGLASLDEAHRACERLNCKNVLGRKLFITVVGPSPVHKK